MAELKKRRLKKEISEFTSASCPVGVRLLSHSDDLDVAYFEICGADGTVFVGETYKLQVLSYIYIYMYTLLYIYIYICIYC